MVSIRNLFFDYVIIKVTTILQPIKVQVLSTICFEVGHLGTCANYYHAEVHPVVHGDVQEYCFLLEFSHVF